MATATYRPQFCPLCGSAETSHGAGERPSDDTVLFWRAEIEALWARIRRLDATPPEGEDGEWSR